MKKVDYTSKEFNDFLDKYFQTEEFKQWLDYWFPDDSKKEDKKIMTDNKLRPNYYKNNNHDLWWYFEHGLMSPDEFRGFAKGNIFKYVTRYQGKNGIEDLEKAQTYLNELINFETKK